MKKTIERNLAEHQEVLAQLHTLEDTIQQSAILMVEALGEESDILVDIPTSGQSANVNHALNAAKNKKMYTVGFLGKGGGQALKIADHAIVIPSESTARIQEMHITIGHILCELIEEGLGLNA